MREKPDLGKDLLVKMRLTDQNVTDKKFEKALKSGKEKVSGRHP